MDHMERFHTLIAKAMDASISGWNFDFIEGRMKTGNVTWDYRDRVQDEINRAHSLLDMGTGGGEFLSSLGPLPKATCATEGYPPNVPVARQRLSPLGVEVFAIDSDDKLPFRDEEFQLVMNRHASYSPREIHRVMEPGGLFITQQVGGHDNTELNDFLGAPRNGFKAWCLDEAVTELKRADFTILQAREEYPETMFNDIGAVVFYLKIVEWQIPGFTVETYASRLLQLHDEIERNGSFKSHSHRFYIEATKQSE